MLGREQSPKMNAVPWIVFLSLLLSVLMSLYYCFSFSIRDARENDVIATLAAESFLWIGLHREKVWSDGSDSLFRYWAKGQPNSGQEQCVTTALSDLGRWSNGNCSLILPFVCYARSNPFTVFLLT